MIPVNEPLLDGNEKKYLNECIDSGWISSEGPFVERFETAFASSTGVKHGIAVANGTAALETALYAIGIVEGDEVIMPSFTIISCAIACLRLGAKPVLVDIDPVLWTMDCDQIEGRITKKTKAIMAVHIYGHPVDMDPVFKIAEKYGLKIIEDAAEVQGAEYFSEFKGKQWLRCGGMGHVSATSFYANKIVTTGEGGMVLTSDGEVAQRARSYRNLCFIPTDRFHHENIGYNFRMTSLQAAVGLAQVEQMERFISIKRRNADLYRERLSALRGLRFMETKPWARSVYWMYAVELKEPSGLTAVEMMGRLKSGGIGTRPFFKGLHAQPVLGRMGIFDGKTFPKTDHAYKYGFYLPSGLTLTEENIDDIAGVIKNAL
jgi:perosamine synthetase